MLKINYKNILIGVLSTVLLFQFFGKGAPPEPKVITIEVPGKKGESGVKYVEVVKPDTVYLQGKDKYIEVDSGYRELYEKASDSISRLNLYLDAISIRKYEGTLVDNSDVVITGKATTRGSLLDYSVEYELKPSKVEYVPEVEVRRPRLALGVGVHGGLPTTPSTTASARGDISLTNQKGNGITLGYSVDGTAWLGVTKTFTIIK